MKKFHFDTICKKYGLVCFTITWLFTMTVHLYLNGVFTGLEAEKYIQEAHFLIDHKHFSASRFVFYSPTILIIYLSLQISGGLYWAFIIQALYNFFINVYFYKSIHKYFKNYSYPFLTIILLVIFVPYTSWTVYLYSESLFYSNVLLLTSSILNHTMARCKKNSLIILLALSLVILSRPLGVIFILPTLMYFFMQATKKLKIILLPIFILGVVMLIYITNIIFSTITDVTITLAVTQECIICGMIPDHSNHLALAGKGSPFFQLYYYVTNNFHHFISLGIIKLKSFFLMVRSYYSILHNLFLLIFIIPIYLLSITYIFSIKPKEYKPFFWFNIMSILIFAFAIMLQCDDYHNRFVLSLYPIFLLMALKGLQNLLIDRKKRNQT